jgi:hypothetical protein
MRISGKDLSPQYGPSKSGEQVCSSVNAVAGAMVREPSWATCQWAKSATREKMLNSAAHDDLSLWVPAPH